MCHDILKVIYVRIKIKTSNGVLKIQLKIFRKELSVGYYVFRNKVRHNDKIENHIQIF